MKVEWTKQMYYQTMIWINIGDQLRYSFNIIGPNRQTLKNFHSWSHICYCPKVIVDKPMAPIIALLHKYGMNEGKWNNSVEPLNKLPKYDILLFLIRNKSSKTKCWNCNKTIQNRKSSCLFSASSLGTH